LKFVHVGYMHTQPRLYVPSMLNIFFPHQVHVVNRWLVWVLNLNILRFWSTTHVWNYALNWLYMKKKIWYQYPKLYICNMLNYMLIVIFNINANVHVLSI
jgi:hypothetical protein